MAQSRNDNKKSKRSIQPIVLSVILIVCLLVCTARAAEFQIIDAEKYRSQAIGIYTRTVTIKAARGEILDCYGRQIAINRDGYSIIFNRANIDMENINNIIIKLCDLLKKQNHGWINELPISFENGAVQYTGTKTDKKRLTNLLNLSDYATAQNCVDHMIKRYSLEGMDNETKQMLMGIRYSIEKSDFSISNPYTFAEDIDTKTMTYISENNFDFQGVSVEIVPFREYVDPAFAPHIIGRVGKIQSEKWDEYKEKGYSYDDKVGISGIEASQEDYLRGKDGEMTYTLDNQGNIISREITKKPIPGNNVILSIDKNLQLSCQKTLQSFITSLNASGGRSTGGAVVVENCHTGEILTAAVFPSYTYDQYTENYSQLAALSSKPLLNRAFSGIYPCGSTIKPAMAIAALQENKVSPGEVITCTGKYKKYDTYQPRCMHVHGGISLNNAIAKSCNFYFYEMGFRLGISKVNNYLKQFGFGQKTGLEISESAGILCEPTRESGWFGGDTLRVSIGQMNAYTPVQIANYVSTIANGGTHYKTTLLHSIESYDYADNIYSIEPTVLNTIELRPDVINTVKNAMLSVTQQGTGSSMFKDYPIKVGGKTGTAQTSNGIDHNVYIAFAPFDNPEIAISVVIEHGASSYTSGSVLKQVFDSYFFTTINAYNNKTANYVMP